MHLLRVRDIPGDVKIYVFLHSYHFTDINNYDWKPHYKINN